MDWDDVRYFLAVVRGEGLTRAALALKVSAATVSRRIDALEMALEQTLFIRRQTGYGLTREGKQLYDSSLAVEEAMLALQRQSQAADSGEWIGHIRLACAEMLGTYWITPYLYTFFARYPRLRVDLLVDVSVTNLSRLDADMAVRFVPPPADEEGDYISHSLGAMSFATYRSATHGTAETDWQKLPCVSWPPPWEHLSMAESLKQALPSFTPVLTSNSYHVQLQAVRAGLGMAVLPCLVADADPHVVRIADAPQLVRQMWLVYHRDLRNSRPIMAMRAFLLSTFADRQAQQARPPSEG